MPDIRGRLFEEPPLLAKKRRIRKCKMAWATSKYPKLEDTLKHTLEIETRFFSYGTNILQQDLGPSVLLSQES